MAKITLDNLAHSYLPNPTGEDDFALKELNHDWDDGAAYALLGPSGCGKSTLLNIISGLLHPSQGRILFDGQDVDNFAVEVDPTMGSAFAFLRSDHSWHGHRPFVGERRVVQIAWLKDDSTLARKTRTNRIAQLLKSITQRQRTR